MGLEPCLRHWEQLYRHHIILFSLKFRCFLPQFFILCLLFFIWTLLRPNFLEHVCLCDDTPDLCSRNTWFESRPACWWLHSLRFLWFSSVHRAEYWDSTFFILFCFFFTIYSRYRKKLVKGMNVWIWRRYNPPMALWSLSREILWPRSMESFFYFWVIEQIRCSCNCYIFILCRVLIVYSVSFDCCVILCDVCCLCVVSYCSTTVTGWKPICS
jgi:hypothetical protein